MVHFHYVKYHLCTHLNITYCMGEYVPIYANMYVHTYGTRGYKQRKEVTIEKWAIST